jgi:hypothetical protein
MRILEYGVFAGKWKLKGPIRIKFKRPIKEFRPCKPNLLPKVASIKVLRQNIPEEQDEKIRVHTTRHPILIVGMMMPISHIWSGRKSKLQERPVRGRWAQTVAKRAQADRPGRIGLAYFCGGSPPPPPHPFDLAPLRCINSPCLWWPPDPFIREPPHQRRHAEGSCWWSISIN